MRIHWLSRPAEETLEELRGLLAPAVVLTAGDEVAEPAAVEAIVAGRPTAEQLDACRDLRILLVPFAGIPAETATLLRDRPRIAIHNLHHNAAPTAEMALALLLAAAKRIVPMDRDLRANAWSGRGRESPAVLLQGRSAVLLGFGAIGRRLAPVFRALGVEVTAVRRSGGETEIDGVRVVPVDRLAEALPRAELLVVCVPLTEATRGLLDREAIGRLPRGAVVVNVARGPVIDEEALFDALVDGRVGAAGLDVWWSYPGRDGDPRDTAPASRPFGELDQVVLSPHRSGSVTETERLRVRHLARSLNAAARGEPVPHPVDLDAGY